MTEEEKKTFNFLKTFVKTEIDYCTLKKADVSDILNIIEKLKKENEEKDKKILGRKFYEVDLNELLKENYIPKDKIREKLEKIEKEKIQYYDAGQPLIYMLLKNQLKSLIEEKQYKNK